MPGETSLRGSERKPWPMARRNESELIFQEVGDEIVVYDVRRQRFFALNSTAASVWRLCDGRTSPGDMAVRVARDSGLEDGQAREVVGLALEQLSRSRLLESQKTGAPRSTASPRRRELLKALGGMISLPVISSLLAPPAAAQFSVPCQGCGPCFSPTNFSCWSPIRGCYCTRNLNQCIGYGGIAC